MVHESIPEGLLIPDLTAVNSDEFVPAKSGLERIVESCSTPINSHHERNPEKLPFTSCYYRQHPYGSRTTYMSNRAPPIEERDNPQRYTRKTPHSSLRLLQKKLSPSSKLSSQKKRKAVEKACRQFISDNNSGPFRDLSQNLESSRNHDFIDIADRLKVLANSCGLTQYSRRIENYLLSKCEPEGNRPEILTFKSSSSSY